MTAHYEVRGDLAVISWTNPPVNGLNHASRKGVADAVRRANADAKVQAIVITGTDKVFSGGADIASSIRQPCLASRTCSA